MLNAYETYYKLSADPFRLNPDHNFSCGHRTYARAKAYLTYALHQGEGFVVVTGGPGTGKTTLINEILAELDQTQVQVAALTTARLVSLELLHMVALSFGLHPEKMNKVTLLTELEQFLIEQNKKGWRTILIVDEAQGLSHSGVEELRLLANLQFNNQLLLQIFLIGQERLVDLIRGPGMEHLRQRIIAASRLEPLDLDETVTYVEQRLFRAGWRGDPKISEDALRLIYAFSGGVPRRINLICSRLFLYGSLEGKHDLTRQDARDVIEDLRRELLLTPESFDEAAAYDELKPRKSGGQGPARNLPRAESFKLFKQARQRSQPQASGTAPTDPVRTVGKGTIVRSAPGKDAGDLVTDSADTHAWRGAESQKDRAPPGIYVEHNREKWTGKLLGIATFLLIAGVIVMAVIRPEIRDSLVATSMGEKDSLPQRPREASETDEHSVATDPEDMRIIRRDSMGARESDDQATPYDSAKGQNGIASSGTLQTVSPRDVATSAESQPSATLALASNRIDIESRSRTSLTTTSEPEEQGNTNGTAVVTEEGIEEDRSGQRKAAEQAPSRQLTQSKESIRRSDAQERASGARQSGADTELKIETNMTTEKKTATESVTIARSEPPVAFPLPTVTESATRPPVPAVRPTVTRPIADKPPAPARIDAPVLIAKATSPPEEKTPIEARDRLKSVLLEGKWKSRGKPAVLLPSEITSCKSVQDRINCRSVPQNINTKYGKALYKVEGTLQDFSAEGDFRLSYRTLVRLARDNETDRSNSETTSGDGSWQITEHVMSCNLTQPGNVRCRDEKGVIRDYRGLGSVERL